VQVVPPTTADGDPDAQRMKVAQFTQRLEDELRSLPSVEGLAMGSSPIGPDPASLTLRPRTLETHGRRRDLRVGVLAGSSELLPVLGLPILRGRGLERTDGTGPASVAVITATLSRTLWPDADPLGQVVSFGARQGTYTIVGVTPDFVYGSLTDPAAGVMGTVKSVGFGIEPTFVLRAPRPDLLMEPIRKLVADIVPDAPRLSLSTGREILSRDLGPQRLGAWFFSGFGVVGLMLGAGGVFGLVAYLAESRQREFGVRLAIGATANEVMRDAAAAGIVPVAVGTVAGLIAAAAVARVFASYIPGVSRFDPTTYVLVAVSVMACATIAGLSAAWRLKRLVPGDALRAD